MTVRVRRFAGPQAHVEQLSHLRIAHLTDIHVGRMTPMKVQYAAAERTNAAKPDLVAMTGDFVCRSQRYLDRLTDAVSAYDAPVVCVLGNHDHWCGAYEVKRALKRAGALVLENQNTTMTLRGQKLQVVGVDDEYTGHADARRAVKGLDRKVATLGLSHIGEVADQMWPHGVSLVLSGHTHGGQITTGKLHHFTAGWLAGHKYVHGLYGCRNTTGAVYVGAGVGASMVPWRAGERGKRELAIFELGSQPGSFDEHHREQAPHTSRKKSRWHSAAGTRF